MTRSMLWKLAGGGETPEGHQMVPGESILIPNLSSPGTYTINIPFNLCYIEIKLIETYI